jgi:hypothetical protein
MPKITRHNDGKTTVAVKLPFILPTKKQIAGFVKAAPATVAATSGKLIGKAENSKAAEIVGSTAGSIVGKSENALSGFKATFAAARAEAANKSNAS